jgi:hypothetical protein
MHRFGVYRFGVVFLYVLRYASSGLDRGEQAISEVEYFCADHRYRSAYCGNAGNFCGLYCDRGGFTYIVEDRLSTV